MPELFIDQGPTILVLLGLLCCSAFFSAAETALFSLSRDEVRRYAGDSSSRGRHITALLAEPPVVLAAILFGNMIVNLSIFTLSVLTALSLEHAGRHLEAEIMTVAAPLAVILFAEVSPKGIAVGRPARMAELLSPFLYAYFQLTRPVGRLLHRMAERSTGLLSRRLTPAPYVTRDELKALIGMAEQQGSLDAHTSGMIEQVVELTDLRAKHVMTPRVDLVVFNLSNGRDAFCDLARRTRAERIVVFDKALDNVAGVLFTRDVFVYPLADLRDLIMPVQFVPETQRVNALIRQLHRERDSVAIVVDEYGGMAGMITIEHILHEVIGEIHEKPGLTAPVQRVDEDTYLLAGDLSVHDWPRVLGGGMERLGVETVAGLVMAILGRVPKPNERIEWHGLSLTVERMSGHRILQVRVRQEREAGQ